MNPTRLSLLLWLLPLMVSACALDFGAFDPRTTSASGGSASGGTGGAGAGPGVGGMGAGGGMASGGNGGVGGGQPVECGSLRAFASEFDTPLDPLVWGLHPIVSFNGAMVFDLDADTFGAVATRRFARLDSLRYQVQATAPELQLTLALQFLDPSVELRLRLTGNVLRVVSPGFSQEVGHDPVTQSWFEIRREGADVVVALSATPQGTFDEVVRVLAPPLDLEHVRLRFAAFRPVGVIGLSQVSVDSLNTELPADAFCPSSMPEVDFQQLDLAMPSAWELDGPNMMPSRCSITSTANGVTLSDVLPYSTCAVALADGLLPRETVVDVAPIDVVGLGPDTLAYIQVGPGFEHFARLGVVDGHLRCVGEGANGAAFVDGPTYDATQHRFWKLRHLADTVVGEVSPDGTTYVEACRVGHERLEIPHQLQLGIDTRDEPTSVNVVTFRQVNPQFGQ